MTTLTSSFEDDLKHAAGAGFTSLEIWLTKLEQQINAKGVADTTRLIADSGLTLSAAAFQGGLLLAQGDQRKAHFDHFKSRLDLCQRLSIPVLLITAGFATSVDGVSLAPAMKNLAEAARWAAGYDVKLALEFHGSDAFCNNLDTALTLVEQCREPNLGVCLDAFHYHRGPSKPEDLERLTRENLFHVQFCDVAGVPREFMTDSDRVMPGDGDFRLVPIMDRLRAMGYAGAVSVELMNPMIWSVSAVQVYETALHALNRSGVVR